MENMTKGVIWVNGQSIGRYWSSFRTVLQKPSQNEFLKPKDNFLVILDEAGGDIDTVQIETVNRDSICSSITETWPASVWSWKRRGNDIKLVADSPQPKASLKCPKDKVVTSVEFASFGNPFGVCGLFLLGNCTSPTSVQITEQHCLGRNSCTIPVDRKLFDKDKDPCPNVAIKSLAVQLRCGRKE